jgi:hypothetical protein
MASPLIIATLVTGLTGFTAPEADRPAHVWTVASDCGAAASRVVRETGGQLLSVQPSGDGQSCVVTVLVQGGGERPRKVTMRVPM